MKYFKRYMLTLRGRCRVILLGQFAFFLAILLSKTNLVFFQASSPDQEFDLHVKMLLLDDAYLTPDDSIESIETPGQKDPPSKSLVQQVFPYSVFVSASLSSAEDSSPLFPLPSVRAIAFFLLQIYMLVGGATFLGSKVSYLLGQLASKAVMSYYIEDCYRNCLTKSSILSTSDIRSETSLVYGAPQSTYVSECIGRFRLFKLLQCVLLNSIPLTLIACGLDQSEKVPQSHLYSLLLILIELDSKKIKLVDRSYRIRKVTI